MYTYIHMYILYIFRYTYIYIYHGLVDILFGGSWCGYPFVRTYFSKFIIVHDMGTSTNQPLFEQGGAPPVISWFIIPITIDIIPINPSYSTYQPTER